VTVALPLRESGRVFPVIASEDALAGERLTALLTSLQFDVRQFRIPADGAWKPDGDVVAICGPKSSPVTAQALTHDPVLDYREDDRGWAIVDRDTGRTYRSPMDERKNHTEDIAYLGRVPTPDGTMLLIAGVHALGSLGAVDYLAMRAVVGPRPAAGVRPRPPRGGGGAGDGRRVPGKRGRA